MHELSVEEKCFLHISFLNTKIINGADITSPIHELELLLDFLDLHDYKPDAGLQNLLSHLFAAVYRGNTKSRQYLYGIRKLHFNFPRPVCIVAGGVKGLPSKNLEMYSEYLVKIVNDFSGTIFSGGTNAGVPGILGDATGKTLALGKNNFQLVGFLPNILPGEVLIHAAYTSLVRTQGCGFSILEPIAMWVEIIAAGIPPGQVILIGINGGKISAFEYRLALALGAQVKVLAGSGRAADELLANEKWNIYDNLVCVTHT